MMDLLLRHVAEMTTHRDADLLDRSLVSAFSALLDASSVRLLDLLSLDDKPVLRQKVWTRNGLVIFDDEDAGMEQIQEPISAFAGLKQALRKRDSMVEGQSADGKTCFLWLPVWLNDKPVSCLEIGRDAPFPQEAHSLVTGILKIYSNFLSLLDYSERDSLTGLLNRKTFDEKFTKMASFSDTGEELPAMYAGQERRRRQLAEDQWLAVVDIDHFKKVNDEYGHLYGDEVLILIANLLRASFRSKDRVFRFGGEEFVIMLRSVTLKNAFTAFERFRRRVEAYRFPQVGRVTVSLGFARISGDTPVVILGRADQALYYAKSNGRNQVCFYDHLVARGELQQESTANSFEFF